MLLEYTARFYFCLMPNSYIKNYKTQAIPSDLDTWALQTPENSNALCLITDSQKLITANFIIVKVKGYAW